MTPARSEQGRRLLDEALRLLDLAQAARPAGARDDDGSHPGPECRICPVCRGIAYLREIDPQAVDRLTAAVAILPAPCATSSVTHRHRHRHPDRHPARGPRRAPGERPADRRDGLRQRIRAGVEREQEVGAWT